MRILARGWSRDHGEKDLLDADILDSPVDDRESVGRYYLGKTYMRVEQRRLGKHLQQPRVRIGMGATLNLNGKYLIRTILTKAEIARLFYLTHSDIRELSDVVQTFASFKNDDYPIKLPPKVI